MPRYEYECTDCKEVTEVQQKISEKPLMTCPICFQPVVKIMSLNTFHLKGNGWYKDGYK